MKENRMDSQAATFSFSPSPTGRKIAHIFVGPFRTNTEPSDAVQGS
jgi:hypothetical protein